MFVSPTASRAAKIVRNVCRMATLLALAILWLACPQRSVPQTQQTGPAKFHIDVQRLQSTLEKLSEFGKNPEGGVTRLGFSETELVAREYVIRLMKQADLQVRVDPAGNIFGLRPGSDKLPILLFGSHIDSVLHGGNFDGALGSLGAIEAIRAMNDRGVKTRHPLEVVIWTNEEGNHFGLTTLGSGVAAGQLGPEILDRKDDQGLTLADWLRRYGQDPARLTDARILPGTLAAFVELHIEQGPNLEENKIPIGVVQGIVGLKRWMCVASGFANHAGTTPMNRRKDALAAASREVLAVRDVVRAEPGRQVGTVGFVKVAPGAVNVIPGRAEFPVELRDLDTAVIDRMWQRIQEKFKAIDEEENVANHLHAVGRCRTRQCRSGGKKCDLRGRQVPRLRHHGSTQRRRARRAKNGQDRAHGHDLRPQPRRHKPFAQRIHLMARRRQWRRSPLPRHPSSRRSTESPLILWGHDHPATIGDPRVGAHGSLWFEKPWAIP